MQSLQSGGVQREVLLVPAWKSYHMWYRTHQVLEHGDHLHWTKAAGTAQYSVEKTWRILFVLFGPQLTTSYAYGIATTVKPYHSGSTPPRDAVSCSALAAAIAASAHLIH